MTYMLMDKLSEVQMFTTRFRVKIAFIGRYM